VKAAPVAMSQQEKKKKKLFMTFQEYKLYSQKKAL